MYVGLSWRSASILPNLWRTAGRNRSGLATPLATSSWFSDDFVRTLSWRDGNPIFIPIGTFTALGSSATWPPERRPLARIGGHWGHGLAPADESLGNFHSFQGDWDGRGVVAEAATPSTCMTQSRIDTKLSFLSKQRPQLLVYRSTA